MKTTTSVQLQPSGITLTIRPIRVTDIELESKFIKNMSAESKHYRFLGGINELSPKMIKRFCEVDWNHTMAFIACIKQDGIEIEVGVSRYAPNSQEDTREIAITVADDWQHLGIGILLAEKTIEFAKSHGIKKLYSIDFADNNAMRHLAKDLGMTSKQDSEDMHQVIYSLDL
jgi:RimJ/RimL family protein N-acetyltransferase